MLNEERMASKTDIKVLKEAIKTAHANNKFIRGWFMQNLDQLIKDDNIYRFYRVQDKGFATAIGYAITKDGAVILLEHENNNVNTAMCISSYYAKYELIRNNFFDLFREDMFLVDEYALMISFREDLREEGIEPWFIELRNQDRIDDEKEEIIKWTNTKEEAVEFAKGYIESHPDVLSYYIGEDEEVLTQNAQ